MADVFDEIEAAPKQDVFDELEAPRQDVFDSVESAPISGRLLGSETTPRVGSNEPPPLPELSRSDPLFPRVMADVEAGQVVVNQFLLPSKVDAFSMLDQAQRSGQVAVAEVKVRKARERLQKIGADPFNPEYYRAREEEQALSTRAKALNERFQADTPLGRMKTEDVARAQREAQMRKDFEASGEGPGALGTFLEQVGGMATNMAGGVLQTLAPSIGGAPAQAVLREGAQMTELANVNQSTSGQIARGTGTVAGLLMGNPTGAVSAMGVVGLKGAMDAYGQTLSSTGNTSEADRAAVFTYPALALFYGTGLLGARAASAMVPVNAAPAAKALAGLTGAGVANVGTTAAIAAAEGREYGIQELTADTLLAIFHARGEYSRGVSERAQKRAEAELLSRGFSEEQINQPFEFGENTPAFRIIIPEGGAKFPELAQPITPSPEVARTITPPSAEVVETVEPVAETTEVAPETPTIDQLATENGLKYDGQTELPGNPHQFTDTRTKSTVLITGEFTPEKLTAKVADLDQRFGLEPRERKLGPGAANIEEPIVNREPVGAWNAKVDEQRAARGLEPLASEARRADTVTWDAAEKRMEENPNYARELVDALNDGKKESVSDTEQAALLREMISLREVRDRATDRAFDEQTYSPEERAAYLEESKAAEVRLERTEEADRKSGTAQGRALRIRRLMAYEDYTLGGLMGKARRAKGEDLTPAETADLKTKSERFKKAKDKFEERMEEAENQPVDEAIRQIEIEASKDPAFTPEVRSLADRIVARLEKASEGARQRLAALRAQFGSGPDLSQAVKITKDLAIMAAADIGRLGIKTTLQFKRWGAKMIREFGEWVKPYLDKAWKQADQMSDEAALGKEPRAEKDENPLQTKAQKALDTAMVERERLDQLLAGEIAPAKKMSREALTELENDVRAEIAAMRGLAAEIRSERNAKPKEDPEAVRAQKALDAALVRREQLDQMLKGEASPAKRVSREALSELENDVQAEIVAMRELALQIRQEQSKPSEIDKAQAALNRALAEKERIEGILAGEITPKKTTSKEALSQMEEDIRLETNALRKLLAEQSAPKTDPQIARENAQVAGLERAAAEYERRLNDADFGGKGKKLGPDTARVSRARGLRDAAKAALDAARKVANPPRTKEQIALDNYKKMAARKTAEMEERIKKGDFGPRPKRAKLDLSKDPEAVKAQAEMERVKREFAQKQSEWQRAQRTVVRKFWDGVKEVAATSRSLITSADVSAPFRQGGFLLVGDLVFNPKRAARQLGTMFRQLVSERGFEEAQAAIMLRPNAKLYDQSGLYLADMRGGLSGREESMRSNLAEKIPLIGRIVRASNRAYSGFLNRQRADTFDAMVESFGGADKVTPQEAAAIADFVNKATGRGTVGGMERSADALARYFFSPRFLASRFQLVTGQPFIGAARQQVAKQYAKFAIGLAAIYGLAWLNGAKVEKDPRSADFGKARFGNTRIDPLSGLAQVTTFLARMTTGKTKQGDTVKAQKRSDTFTRFARTKLAPIPGVAADFAAEKTLDFKEPTVAGSAQRLAVPISYQDAPAVFKEHGAVKGTIMEVLNLLGMGVQNYQRK